MAIAKSAVRAFFKRRLRDYRPWKRKSFDELRTIKDKLPVRPPIWKKLKKHQRICLLIAIQVMRFCFWLDTGCGKTLLSIAIARYLKKAGKVNRFLVLTPNRINPPEWAREIRKHSPRTKYLVLSGSSKKKWEQLQSRRGEKALLVITTYGGLVRMACDVVMVKQRNRKKPVPKLKPNKKKVKELCRYFDGLFMDESDNVSNHQALASRICRQISRRGRASYCLSGTPFGRDPTPLWNQFYLADLGSTLGATLGLFRAAFFKSVVDYWSGFPVFSFDKRKKRDLHNMMANGSIRYKAGAADLPKVIPVPLHYKLPIAAEAYYEAAKETLVESHGNFRESKNAFIRMRQISSGYIGYWDDEIGDKAEYVFPFNPKLEGLISKLHSLDPKVKVVVFHEFIPSGRFIAERLKKEKIGFVHARGSTKKLEAALADFDHDPNKRVFLVNNAAGAYGLNLQVASWFIYYESPVRPIIRYQTRRRVERQYSKHHKVFMCDLIVENAYDVRILEYLEEGRDLFEAIVEGKDSGFQKRKRSLKRVRIAA